MNEVDDFKLLGKVHLTIERRDSKFVPYDIVQSEFEGEVSDPVVQDLFLITTDQIPLPEFDFKLEVGDRLEFSADFYGHYYSYSTDCGTEHDAEFEFRDVKDLLVWRVAYEQA